MGSSVPPQSPTPPPPASLSPRTDVPAPAAVDGEPTWRWPTALLGLVVTVMVALVGIGTLSAVAAGIGGYDSGDTPSGVEIGSTFILDGLFVVGAVLTARTVAPVGPKIMGWRLLRFITPWRAALLVAAGYVVFLLVTAGWIGLLGVHDESGAKVAKDLGVDSSDAARVAVLVLTCIVAPMCEETFFRGFLFPGLRRSWGLVWAALATGLVFGAVHLGSAPAAYLLPLALLGVMLCLLYAYSGSLLPCMALHCINNSIAFGVSLHWGWQVPLVVIGSLATIALVVRGVWALNLRN